jgi:hypothetical protein
MMTGGFAFGDDNRSLDNGSNDASNGRRVIDTLDQNVALGAETGHDHSPLVAIVVRNGAEPSVLRLCSGPHRENRHKGV